MAAEVADIFKVLKPVLAENAQLMAIALEKKSA